MGKSRTDQFLSERGTELQEFFREAVLNGYGSDSSKATVLTGTDGGAKIVFNKGDWSYIDEYFGGEPYAGMTHVSYKGKVVFVLTYGGTVLDLARKQEIYACLHAALATGEKGLPWRGPNQYTHANGLQYICHRPTGDPPKSFVIKEEIVDTEHPCEAVYTAQFHGLIVNMD